VDGFFAEIFWEDSSWDEEDTSVWLGWFGS